MFEFSKIDKELTIYKENDVIIFGASKSGLKVKHLLERHGIGIVAFVDNDAKKIGNNIEGVGIISIDGCAEYIYHHKNTVVQIGSVHERELAEQLKSEGIDSYIWYSEFMDRIRALNKNICCNEKPELKGALDEIEWQTMVFWRAAFIKESFMNDFQYTGNIRLMLSAPKVGNTTIEDSLSKRNENMFSIPHSYEYLEPSIRKLLFKYPVKLIMGVRDPVKQNLSLMYEMLTTDIIESGSYYDLAEYWNAGGNVRTIFNEYVIKNDKNCYLTERSRKRKCDCLVQNFFEQQIQPFFGVDVYQYPFDKEKGFSVYHINDKLSIMIYQLEKLSGLAKEIGTFLGIKNLELEIGNDSAGKWYRESYMDVVKNMPLDKQYYTDCYTGKYIKHFYSEEDIEKFKAQWKVDES